MKKIVFILLTGIVVTGCYYDNAEDLYQYYPQNPCDTTAVTYSVTISQIMSQQCTSCHGSSAPEAGLDLSSYNGVLSAVNSGELMNRITLPLGAPGKMPVGGSLSDCQINQIKAWIDAGANNN